MSNKNKKQKPLPSEFDAKPKHIYKKFLRLHDLKRQKDDKKDIDP